MINVSIFILVLAGITFFLLGLMVGLKLGMNGGKK